MHSAPALSYPVGRSRFQGALVGLTGLVGVVTGLLWQAQAGTANWRQGLFAMTLLGAFIVAVQAWRRSPRGHLSWDGQAWRWAGMGQSASGRLTVHLDFQFFLLLSLRPDSGARIWLWPERRSEIALWNALRRAVFSHGRAGQLQDARVAAQSARR